MNDKYKYPERVYLQIEDDYGNEFDPMEPFSEATWCSEQINESDLVYAPERDLAQLRKECEDSESDVQELKARIDELENGIIVSEYDDVASKTMYWRISDPKRGTFSWHRWTQGVMYPVDEGDAPEGAYGKCLALDQPEEPE